MTRGRRWSGPVPADEERCTRNDGKKWRCYVPRHPGSIYCHQHRLAYIAKCKGAAATSSSYRPPRPKTPIPKPKNPVGRPPKTPTTTTTRVSRTPAELYPGQIWAFSQAPDPKIPRHYARIDRRLPGCQSSVLATPLIPHPVLDEEIHWADTSNRIMSCGAFRASPKKPMMAMDASAFAFQVASFKTVRWMGIPFYMIFPNKGEVWAVSGKQQQGGEECKLVEVLSDFSEEEGVTVAGLVPVEGKGDGVYGLHLHEGFRLVQTYERREMVMFSHRVAAERAEGGEGGDNQLWKVVVSN